MLAVAHVWAVLRADPRNGWRQLLDLLDLGDMQRSTEYPHLFESCPCPTGTFAAAVSAASSLANSSGHPNSRISVGSRSSAESKGSVRSKVCIGSIRGIGFTASEDIEDKRRLLGEH